MRKAFLFAGLVLALVALAVLLPGSARSDAGGTNLPLNGYFAGTTELNLLNGQLHIEGTGTSTHLGSATLVLDGYAIPDGSGGFFTFTTFVSTAANGEQLSGACTGHAITTANGDHVSTTNCVIAGGTGRFEGSTGQWTGTSLTFNLTVVGTTLRGEIEGTADGVLSLNLP